MSLDGDVKEESLNGEKDENGWILELETALLSDCDINVIRRISSQRVIPSRLRYEYWQVCLGIKGRTKVLEDIFDLPEQNIIRQDCQKLVENLDNSSSEKLSILSDLESILTNFSRLNSSPYDSNNGWIDLLGTLIYLHVKRDELFKVFETIQRRYITRHYNSSGPSESRSCKSSYMQPFHLLRLLLLYHDPELCNLFDTLKLTTEHFASTWFRCLFCSMCKFDVSLSLLDTYFTYANPFLIFYLSLVIIINLKDELKTKNDRDEIVSMLSNIPSSLGEADIKDMFYIAEQHFLNNTPFSVKDFQPLLFQVYEQNDTQSDIYQVKDLSSFLCLPISVHELLSSCQNKSGLHYFVVDCRPPDQYNNGHFVTAFHLDCSLMLNDPIAFSTAVQALLASQKLAIEANSVAGGEHLCFIGSGRDEEDCYVHMVVSSFLQKRHKYVSLLLGGYESLHRYVVDNHCEQYLVDHTPKGCLVCLTSHKSNSRATADGEFKNTKDVDQLTSVFFHKISTVVKPRFAEMKDKLVEYVVNPNQKPVVKHVSHDDKLGKRYKGSKFSLDDTSTDDYEEDEPIEPNNAQEIQIEEWKTENNLIGFFQCSKINSDSTYIPGFLALTNTHLYLIKELKNKKGYGSILVKRPLEMIVQITSKRKWPEIITFKYGHTGQNNESVLVAKDSLLLVEPFEVIRLIKQQVVNLLDQSKVNNNE